MKGQEIKKYLPWLHWSLTLGLLLWVIFSPGSKPDTSVVTEIFTQSTKENTVSSSHQLAQVSSFSLPERMTFAGEEIPLHIRDVAERMDRELHTNAYWHTNTLLLMKRANRWFPQMREILARYEVPEDFLYLSLIESSLINQISPRGATGFWQIMAATGKEFGLEISDEVDERYDPLKSTEVACKYLLRSYKKFGNWTHVAASYNMGMQGFYRSLVSQKTGSYYDAYLNEETARYIFRIVAVKEIFENPHKYGYGSVREDDLYQPTNCNKIEVKESIADLADWARKQGINYKVLKLNNPWLRKSKLSVKKGKTYSLCIPLHPFEEVSGELDDMPRIDSLLEDMDTTVILE